MRRILSVFFFGWATILIVSCEDDNLPVPVGFGEEMIFATHREIEVGWVSSDGVVLSGTLFLPRDQGLYGAVIWHFGSNRWTRSPFDNSAANRWLAQGIAVLTYDKRGVGRSQGKCCPWTDPDYFPLLGSDVLTGVLAIAGHPEIDSSKIGAFGFSQGGWVVPPAAAEGNGFIAYTIIGSRPTVTLGEELLYSELTGESNCVPTGLPVEEIDAQLLAAGPSLFDPLPFLQRMENPGLWIYGEKDLSVPVTQSVAILDSLISQDEKPFTYIVIPEANHSWFLNGEICQENGVAVDMLPEIFQWITDHI